MAATFPKYDELLKKPSSSEIGSNVALRGREKKREWFNGRYNDDKPGKLVRSTPPCRFFSATGNCREGESCRFLHAAGTFVPKVIGEPCKFLYTGNLVCKKGSGCHFSHDVENFPCPIFARHNGICSSSCQFDHTAITSELAAIQFVRMYQAFLISLGDTVNPRWMFYLKDMTEDDVLESRTNTAVGNPFNIKIGSLSRAEWI